MPDFLTFIFPFFSTPKNYDQVIRKIAGATFWVTYIATFILRGIPSIDQALHDLETYGKLGTLVESSQILNFNPAGFVIAVAFALSSHLFQLHDRLSDAFGIRRNFDHDSILIPLATLVGAHLTDAQIEKLRNQRHSLMRQVFYKYASSSAQAPLVDRHDIEHALAAWSWFWILLEATVVLCLSGITAGFFGAFGQVFGFFATALLFAICAWSMFGRLERRARAEIETIAASEQARLEVRSVFDAL